MGSTRSSLTSDLLEIPKAPSIISNASDHDHDDVRSSSPAPKDIPPINVEHAGTSAQIGDANANVAEVEDEEFVNISSGSLTAPDQLALLEESDTSAGPPGSSTVANPQGGPSDDPAASISTTPLESTVTAVNHPELKNNIGNSLDSPPVMSGQSRVRDASNQSATVDKKRSVVKADSRSGKKVSKKEYQKSTRKGRSKTEPSDKFIDDNQSEMSYQPDTDLSRSRASRKANGVFLHCM